MIQEVQTGTQQYDNIFSTPTLWNDTIYYHCAQDVVKAYSWDPNTGMISTDPISKGTVVYGGHGATSSLSANGTTDGILWEIEHDELRQRSCGALRLRSRPTWRLSCTTAARLGIATRLALQ